MAKTLADEIRDYKDLVESRSLIQNPQWFITLPGTNNNELVDILLAIFTHEGGVREIPEYGGQPQMIFNSKEEYDRAIKRLRKLGVKYTDVDPLHTKDGNYECADVNTVSPYPGNKGMKDPI